MGIYRSTDPTVYDEVDGIIINESAPAPNIAGVAANVALMVAEFERGPLTLTEVGSIGELQELFGKSNTFGGNLALRNKKFGRLRVIRALDDAAVKGTITFDDGAVTDIITFVAKYFGAYGLLLKVTIEAGSDSGRKYTIEDTSANAVLPAEVYDNIVITAITAETFAASKLVDVSVDATSAEPAIAAATALAAGSDGTIADVDYETAIAKAEVASSCNVLFLDTYNSARNTYLKTHHAATQDKMCILAGLETDARSDAVTDVASYRDSDGGLIYAYPWVETVLNGAVAFQSPASWYASLFSQTSPHIDPAYAANTQYLAGITGLKLSLTRADYIALKDAGISAFEIDATVGVKIKSGIVTQIADTSKLTVLRRRMAYWLTNSIAAYLVNYQNAPNTAEKRGEVGAAILAFVQAGERDKILPKDAEVQGGNAKLIDTESLNTDTTIALGFFKIQYRQRIYSAMRYIVLVAEIGESVVVTEG